MIRSLPLHFPLSGCCSVITFNNDCTIQKKILYDTVDVLSIVKKFGKVKSYLIAALDLSQSSVSRHLKQLVAMKYLYERRGEGANKTYRLSSSYTTFKDSAALRRALYDYRFMHRTRDGSRYWLIGSEVSEQELRD